VNSADERHVRSGREPYLGREPGLLGVERLST
jgi:hypothetical protein